MVPAQPEQGRLAGVDICVNRISTVDEELVEQYNAISGPLLDISRQLQKSLLRQLVCFGGALLTGGPLYFLARNYLSNSAAAC